MRQTNIFEWAEVYLAEECSRILFQPNTHKDSVLHLENINGITMNWGDNGLVKLKGPWKSILKSQMVLTNLMKSIECSDIKRRESNKSSKWSFGDIQCEESSSQKTKDKSLSDENEVYVNITLSDNFHSELNHKSTKIMHSIHEENLLQNTTPENIEFESCLSSSSYYNKTESLRQSIITNALSLISPNLSASDNFQTDGSRHVSKDSTCIASSIQKNSEKSYPKKHLHSQKEVTSKISDEYLREDNTSQNCNNNIECAKNISSLRNNLYSRTDIRNALESESINDGTVDLSVKMISPKRIKKKDYEELTPYKYFCALCSFKSKRESHFTKHMTVHKKISEVFKCNQCSFSTIRLSHLRRHELVHSKPTLFCDACQYHTNNPKLLNRHKQIKHSSKQSIEDDVNKDILQCVHCEYQTRSYLFLQRHMRIHITDSSSIQMYQCEECSYKTNRKEHFVRHTNNIHKGHRPFLCHQCGKAFKRQDALKQHVSTHSSQASIICSECGKGCKSSAHLSQHMSVHSSERSFLCELCGASFKTRAVHRKHMLTIHQHPKAFPCSHCSRKFSTKFALLRHIKQHSFVLSEKNIKSENQPISMTSSNSTNNCSPKVGMDTFDLTDPTRTTERNLLPNFQKVKNDMQPSEIYEAETVQIIPVKPVIQCTSETGAFLYLAGTFTPL